MRAHGEEMLRQTKSARSDLAERLDVPLEDVRPLKAKDTVWNDSSYGCAQPDHSYAMVLVPGIIITLEANGEVYTYHGADGIEPFLCRNPTSKGQTPNQD